jgi:hypothetical protein
MNTDLIKHLITLRLPGLDIVETFDTRFDDETTHILTVSSGGTELGYVKSTYTPEDSEREFLLDATNGCFTTESASRMLKKVRSDYLRLV